MEEEINFQLPTSLEFCSDKYEILDIAGEGTFSSVYKARCLRTNRAVAIKAITKSSSPDRVLEELNILKQLDGKSNCIKLIDVLRSKDQIIVVFPLIRATDFKDFITMCSMNNIKNYMYNLLLAVNHLHSNKIILRDIKPSNCMYSLENDHGYLIDFGLAQLEKIKAP